MRNESTERWNWIGYIFWGNRGKKIEKEGNILGKIVKEGNILGKIVKEGNIFPKGK
jgi:hypothetical protein